MSDIKSDPYRGQGTIESRKELARQIIKEAQFLLSHGINPRFVCPEADMPQRRGTPRKKRLSREERMEQINETRKQSHV